MSNLNRKSPQGAPRINLKNIIKVDYATEAAIALIKNYGSRYDWYNALVCPCTFKSQQIDKKFGKISCGLCSGTRWAYVLNKEIRAVPSSIRREEQTLTYRVPEEGLMNNIYINLTCEPVNKINIRDKLVFKESVTFRSEATVFDPSKETYKFTSPIVELLRVIDEDGKEYDANNFYPERRDVDIDTDGLLYWVDGNKRPPVNMTFSILYSFFPSYIIISAVHEIRGFMAGKPEPEGVQSWEDLPRLVTAKLEIPGTYLFK
jgi:hypothetical protein